MGLEETCVRIHVHVLVADAVGVYAQSGSWWGRVGAARVRARLRRRCVWAGVVLVVIDGCIFIVVLVVIDGCISIVVLVVIDGCILVKFLV